MSTLFRTIPPSAWTAVKGGLLAGAVVYTATRESELNALDLTNPSHPRDVALPVPNPESGFEDSVTLQQLAQERPFFRRFISPEPTWEHHRKDIDRTLLCRFLLWHGKTRKRMTEFVTVLVKGEIEERGQGNVVVYHGTNQSAYLLFQTALAQQLQPEMAGKVALRAPQITEALAKDESAHEYYKRRQEQAHNTIYPVSRTISYGNGMFGCEVGWKRESFDDRLPDIRAALLSANHGFFGQSIWVKHGWHESSAAFMLTQLSSLYKAWDLAPVVLAKEEGLFVALEVMVKKFFQPNASVSALVDAQGKQLQDSQMFQTLFKERGVEHLYPKYAQELQQLHYSLPPALLQCSIPRLIADKYCYLAGSIGLMASKESVWNVQTDPAHHPKLPLTQVRVFLHPLLQEAMKVRMYTLGSAPEVRSTVKRLVEIAKEVADQAAGSMNLSNS